jgi:hypothetical protein
MLWVYLEIVSIYDEETFDIVVGLRRGTNITNIVYGWSLAQRNLVSGSE